jgi:hypothetical protein
LTLSMMGQRVLPQRKRAPLQTTHRLLWRERATIWFSSNAEPLLLLIRLFTQLSEELELRCLYVRVMVVLLDSTNGFICLSHLETAKARKVCGKRGCLRGNAGPAEVNNSFDRLKVARKPGFEPRVIAG